MKFLPAYAFIVLVILLTSASADTSLSISWSVMNSAIRPGGTTTVLLTLTNPSSTSDIGTIKLSIAPGPYLTVSTTYAEFDSLSRSANQQTSFYVTADSSATSIDSYVKVVATYYAGPERDVVVNIPIYIRRIPLLQISDVSYNKSIIEPGSITRLSFNLVNNGDGAAKDIRVVLNQSGKIVATNTEDYFIGSIETGKKSTVEYMLTVDPNIAIGTYSIPIDLKYYDELKNTTYSDTKNIGLVVSGRYNFVIVAESQTVVAPDKDGSVSLQIANAGNQEALYLTLKMLPSDPLVQIIPAEVYMGNLKSDDYDLQELKFKVSESASISEYPLKLELRYDDLYGRSYKESHQVNVKVSSLGEFSKANKTGMSYPTILLIVVAVFALLFFVYRRFKK